MDTSSYIPCTSVLCNSNVALADSWKLSEKLEECRNHSASVMMNAEDAAINACQ